MMGSVSCTAAGSRSGGGPSSELNAMVPHERKDIEKFAAPGRGCQLE